MPSEAPYLIFLPLQSHPNKLFTDEVLTVMRILKTNGYTVSEKEVLAVRGVEDAIAMKNCLVSH